MIRKLRIVCPVCIICLAVLVFSVFGTDSNAASTETQNRENNAAVTYTADSWSTGGMAVPATAQETSAALPENGRGTATYDDADIVPAQAHHSSGYKLTEEERIRVERAVMCEAGGEGETGQMMVAQCILDGTLRNNFNIAETIEYYDIMSTSYSKVTDEVKKSVARVFDNGERVTEAKADLWYNPAITPSEWHEDQEYITTIGSHRFFWMRDNSEA